MHDSGSSFQQLADEAFEDLLKTHHQPIGFEAALKESVLGSRRPLSVRSSRRRKET